MEHPIGKLIFDGAASFISDVITHVITFGGQNETILDPMTLAPAAPPAKRIIFPVTVGCDISFVRLAGLCGASAVIIGAVGNHYVDFTKDDGDKKCIFDTAYNFHLFQSFGLMGVPLAKYPCVTGVLMLFGVALFTGPMYYQVFSNDSRFAFVTPWGSVMSVLAWLSFLL